MINDPVTCDVILASFPNKTIEIPSLGLAILKSVLVKNNFSCSQVDYNVLLKDAFVEPTNLRYLADEVLPCIWKWNLDSQLSDAVLGLIRHIKRLETDYTLERLLQVKLMLQARQFEAVFSNEETACLVPELLALLSKSSLFFEWITSNPKIEITFSDLFAFRIIDALLSQISEQKPALLGFSVVELQRPFTLWGISKLRKQYAYTGMIAVGGSDVTYFKEKYLLNFDMIDYAVYQEGEDAIVKLAECCKYGSVSPDEIPNLIHRKNGQVKVNAPQSCDDFTKNTPDFSGLPLAKYLTNALPVQASRGCSWAKCTFCKHFKTYGKDYIEGNALEVVDQIKFLMTEYRTDLFHFVDDDFPVQLKNQVSAEIIRQGLCVNWLGYSRFEKNITKPMLEDWYRSGLLVIEWGLESASPNVLKHIKKGIDTNEIRRLLIESSEVGLLNKLFMFHNLPSESYEDLWASLTFLKSYVKSGIIRPFWEIRTPLELLEGTPLYEESFSDAKFFANNFKKVFRPRGDMVVQAGYVPNEIYGIKQSLITSTVTELAEISARHNILDVNDEAIMFDVILEKLRMQGVSLKLNTRLPSYTTMVTEVT